jgi:hypothetical protein
VLSASVWPAATHAACHRRLSVPSRSRSREPVAQFDLAEERLTVLGVAHGDLVAIASARDALSPRARGGSPRGSCGRVRSERAGRRRSSTPSPSRVIVSSARSRRGGLPRRRRREAGSIRPEVDRLRLAAPRYPGRKTEASEVRLCACLIASRSTWSRACAAQLLAARSSSRLDALERVEVAIDFCRLRLEGRKRAKARPSSDPPVEPDPADDGHGRARSERPRQERQANHRARSYRRLRCLAQNWINLISLRIPNCPEGTCALKLRVYSVRILI